MTKFKYSATVIIPTYNRSWGLKRAVESVLRQTTEDFELLIVDDASTDDSQDVAQSFDDTRVRYYRQPGNVGVVQNWGTGLKLARGEYVSLLMDDDCYEAGFLKSRINALRSNPIVAFAFGGYKVVDEDGRQIKLHVPPHQPGATLSGRDLVAAILAQDSFVGATLYRTTELRAVWSMAASADLIIDYAMNVRLAIRPEANAIYVGGTDFVRAVHDGQLSQTRAEEVFDRTLQMYDNILSMKIPLWLRFLVRRYASYLLVQGGRGAAASGDRRMAVRRLILAAGYNPLWRGPWTQLIRVITGHWPQDHLALTGLSLTRKNG